MLAYRISEDKNPGLQFCKIYFFILNQIVLVLCTKGSPRAHEKQRQDLSQIKTIFAFI
jgi:hypothetical protein